MDAMMSLPFFKAVYRKTEFGADGESPSDALLSSEEHTPRHLASLSRLCSPQKASRSCLEPF